MPRPPQPSEAIAIPHDSWFKLYTGRLQDMDNPKELWEVAVEAIDEWTRRHHPDGFTQVTHVGYQWKHLFLPPGTLLRTIFRGKNYHCLVEAEHLLYKGKPVSPNTFVNAVGGIRRNAWRSIWVLYPNTTEWKLADSLRTRTRSRPSRARRVPNNPVQVSVPTPPPDAADGTLPVQRCQAAPQLAKTMPEFPAVAPPHVHDAGNAGAPGARVELRTSAEPVVAPGAGAQCTDDGRAESALARLLLAELLAFMQRLGPARQRVEKVDRAYGKWPAYNLNTSSYTTSHMRMVPQWSAAQPGPD